MLTAYNLWVNGELIASAGNVGKTRETMTPQYLPQVALFESQQGTNEKIEQQKLELENVNRQLQELSLKDPLTKLWNRRKYDETINLEWNRCLRYQRPIALILLDIDYFKKYNDFYGHIAKTGAS